MNNHVHRALLQDRKEEKKDKKRETIINTFFLNIIIST